MISIPNKGTLAAICLVLTGCAHSTRCPTIPGGPEYCLQPSSTVPAFFALQDIRIRRHEMDERLIGQLEVDADGMRLACLTPMGQRLLEASFDNRQAFADSVAGDRIDARALLSLVQLSSWPADAVRTGLAAEWDLEESPGLRQVLRAGRTYLEIRQAGKAPNFSRLKINLPDAEMTISVTAIEEETGHGR